MKKFWFVWLCSCFLLTQSEDVLAQVNKRNIKNSNKKMAGNRDVKSKFGKDKVYNQIGVSVGAVNYYGDLSAKKSIMDLALAKAGWAVSYTHRFGPRYSLQAQFMFATIKGSDAESADTSDANDGVYRYKRNLSFRNQIKEISVVGVIDLFENHSTHISRVKWTPYLYAGVAAFLHNPQALAPATDLQGNVLSQAGKWVDLQPLGTEGQHATLAPTDANSGIQPYSAFQFAIPMGIGARFRINELMDIWADVGFRYTFTDYLDDVSRNYVDLPKLASPLAQAMSYRTNELYNGNPPNPTPSGIPGVNVEAGYGSEGPSNKRGSKNENDLYMVTSLRLTYIIDATHHKAKFR